MTLREAIRLGQQVEKSIKELDKLSLCANPVEGTASCPALVTYCDNAVGELTRLLDQPLFRPMNN